MVSLIGKESKSYHKQKVCYMSKKGFHIDHGNKKYHKVRDHYYYTGKYRGVVHFICNVRYKTPK